jgi:hypothetical protein
VRNVLPKTSTRRTQPKPSIRLESEAIVKVFCAVQGTKAELLSTIETIRAQGLTMRRHGTQVAQEYEDGRNAFPERMHTSALMFDFLWQYSGALIQWAERATQAVTVSANQRGDECTIVG